MKCCKYLIIIVISFVCCQGLIAQTDQKSWLRQKFERDRKAMRQSWQQRLAVFEQEFNRSRENACPFQENELKKDENNSAITSIETNMDSNYVIVEAIAVGKDKQEAIDLVENAVMKNMLEKAKEIIQFEDPGQIDHLAAFLKENHIPLIKKLTPISPDQIQARFKVEQPLLGSNGLLQFIPDSSVSQSHHPVKALEDKSIDSRYTGLILDVRDLNAKPNLIIYIKHEGKTFYGPSVVDRNQAMKKGMIKWCTSLDDARVDPRAGSNPFVLIPTHVEKNRVYQVRSEDEKILAAAGFQNNILKNCRVIIVK